MTRRLTWLVAAAALAGGPARANPADRTAAASEHSRTTPPPGDSRRVIAILDVRVGSGVPAEIAAQFQHDLNEQIDPKHFWLAPHALVQERMTNSTKWTDGCLVGECLTELRAQTGAEVALLAALTGSGTSFGSVVTLVRTDNGEVVAQDTERCDVCTLHEALGKAERATVKLLESLPPKLPTLAPAAAAVVERATRPLETTVRALQRRDHRHKIIGAALAITGLVAAAAGLVMYENGHANNAMAATTAAGAGLALSGVVVLTF